MHEQKPSSQAPENSLPAKDIAPIIKGWAYEPGTINVRKVIGSDGNPKLQMRLSMGLLQMEMSGRPDGERPHGFESLLDYFESQLKDHRSRNGTELGFHLTGEQCHGLREEAMMYYHRYLSLFVLEEFPAVVRDTQRNMRLMDLCAAYAMEERDRLMMEQYRPYITMMNTRAAASIAFKEKRYGDALTIVQEGMDRIGDFFRRFGQEERYSQINEVKVLEAFARDIRGKMPADSADRLQERLERAIREERYEEAARLRDLIASKSAGSDQ